MANDCVKFIVKWTTNMKSFLFLWKNCLLDKWKEGRKGKSKQYFEWCLPYLDVVWHAVTVLLITNHNSFPKLQMIAGGRVEDYG